MRIDRTEQLPWFGGSKPHFLLGSASTLRTIERISGGCRSSRERQFAVQQFEWIFYSFLLRADQSQWICDLDERFDGRTSLRDVEYARCVSVPGTRSVRSLCSRNSHQEYAAIAHDSSARAVTRTSLLFETQHRKAARN